MQNYNDEYWMRLALKQAQIAEQHDEVPVGAIVVLNNEIIGRGFNQPISTLDPCAHAEIVALRDAANTIKNYRLLDATMYVTLEPCMMCTGAIIHSRIKKLVYGAKDSKTGVIDSKMQALDNFNWNHSVEYKDGILSNECGFILRNFFKQKRNKN